MEIWSNDLQCFRAYSLEKDGALPAFGESELPYNLSNPGEEFDDSIPLYGSQVHLARMLSDAEIGKLRAIESMFDQDGDWPEEGEAWDAEEHRCWLNFDYFSDAARNYLISLA